jgi:hypothetical protein
MSFSTNTLLSSLSTSDFDLLAPHLEAVTLGLRKTLEKPNQRIEDVYFPRRGSRPSSPFNATARKSRSD